MGVTTSHIGSVASTVGVTVKKSLRFGSEELSVMICAAGNPASPVVVCHTNDRAGLLITTCGGEVMSRCTGTVNGLPFAGEIVMPPS